MTVEAIRLEADAFLYSEAELEEAMESVPDIEGASQAGGFLRAMAHYDAERERCAASYDEVILQYEADKARKLEKIDRQLAWLESALHAHYVHSGEKKLDYPDGTMTLRKGRESVVVEDPEAFCDKHIRADYVTMKTVLSPNKKAIMEIVKNGGEIPEGADIVRGPHTFVIKTK
jgi:uncharacterized protein YlzI (FlbEa/FlbD family)